MRQSRKAKAATHGVIVAQASRLFRERGIEGTSVADVMQAAERTHGGFYRHFETKEALLAAALDAAFSDMVALMEGGFAEVGPARAMDGFLSHYLSPARVEDVAGGCPIAALSGDIARGSAALKAAFGARMRVAIDTLATALDEPEPTRQHRAARAFALAAGAVMMARASDPETAELLLAAARGGRERASAFSDQVDGG